MANTKKKKDSIKFPSMQDILAGTEPAKKEVPEKAAEPVAEPVKEDPKVEDPKQEAQETKLIEVIDKSNVGRPKVLTGVYKPISARLKMENYEHARVVGGRFGGMNAYINWLIEEDMKRQG